MQDTIFNTGVNIMIEALNDSDFSSHKKRKFKKYIRELSQSYGFINDISDPPEIKLVINYILKYFSLTKEQLVSNRRFDNIMEVKHVLTFILSEHYDLTPLNIAVYSGRKERTSIYNSLSTIINIIKKENNHYIINSIFNIESFLIENNIIKENDRTIKKLIELNKNKPIVLFKIKI
jgi:chromosomal replication initiation ATPase DnaA